MFEALDAQARLTGNQWRLISAGAFGLVLEFLDYFLIGFILTFVVGPWRLTIGESSIILLASGVGAMLGATFFGRLADQVGRRRVFMVTIGLFTASMAALIVTPDNPAVGWIYLSAFRLLIGIGAGGLYCVDLPLIQEFMPSRRRGAVSGLVTCAVPLGFLIGSALVAFAAPLVGWRGLVAVCVGLGLVTLLMRRWIPESPRWLMLQGRVDEARRSIAWALEVDAETLPVVIAAASTPKGAYRDLLRYPRSLLVAWLSNLGMQTGYYGLTLWGPLMIVATLHVAPAKAAFYMLFVTSAALGGRITFSLLSEAIGRRTTGAVAAGGAAALLIVAGFCSAGLAGAVVGFIAVLMLIFFFGEGGFAIVGPYSAEVWPTSLRATGMGAAYGFGGLGKIIGPLGLAVIVGTSTAAAPTASHASFQIAFLYFAVWYALASAAFVLFGVETGGRSIEALDGILPTRKVLNPSSRTS